MFLFSSCYLEDVDSGKIESEHIRQGGWANNPISKRRLQYPDMVLDCCYLGIVEYGLDDESKLDFRPLPMII